MSLEMVRHCPECGEETTYWLSASTLVHLGKKTKWHCSECDHSVVRIGEEIEADAYA
jgi:endogenous inhibitor of DNA gyrase (YacG/DUF329 family)